MFADLLDEEIQPGEIDGVMIPEIEVSRDLRDKLSQMFQEEEKKYVRVSAATSIVQTDKNYVIFSNQWFYLAVVCKKYAEVLYSYCSFFDEKIRTIPEIKQALKSEDYNHVRFSGLFSDDQDKERMIKFIKGGSNKDFRPGKDLLGQDSIRSIKDIFGSCILKKILVPDASSNYLGSLVYYLVKRPVLFDQLADEVNAQVQNRKGVISEFEYNQLPELFRTDFSRRFITALLAKPFVILTGNSGTGKTRIARQLSEYLEVTTDDGEKNWLIVPVGADWTDNVKVLGFFNPLADDREEKYVKTNIVKLIERADRHKDIPYFLVLDEMNLSHVERYFSDFLSHMETLGLPFELEGYEEELEFPDNLFVVGTVNIDETTYMFSPKVLDRSNVIEFKPEKEDVLGLFAGNLEINEVVPANNGTAEAFLELARRIRTGTTDGTIDMQSVKSLFETVYVIVLEKHKNKTPKIILGHKYSTCRIGR